MQWASAACGGAPGIAEIRRQREVDDFSDKCVSFVGCFRSQIRVSELASSGVRRSGRERVGIGVPGLRTRGCWNGRSVGVSHKCHNTVLFGNSRTDSPQHMVGGLYSVQHLIP